MGGTLATRYLNADVTTQAGGTIAAPTTTTVRLGNLILVSVHLLIPTGHAGLTGWRLDYSGTTIVPYNLPAGYISGDDDRLDFDIDYEVGNTLQIVTYNLDVYPHTHYCRMKVTDLTDTPVSTLTPLTVTPL